MPDFHFTIGLFSLAHITLAGLGVGLMVLTPWVEFLGISKPVFTTLAYRFTKFTVITYTVSIVLAVFMLELFIGLFPLTNTWLFNQFRTPIYVALMAFFLQLMCLYAYYHFWDIIRAKSVALHITLIGLATVFILIWVSVLDGIGSFMLTPNQGDGGWAKVMNSTWIPLVVHRFFGNLVMVGYVLAGYAAWEFPKNSDGSHTQYVHTLIKTGLTVGLCALLIQPLTGLVYAFRILDSHPDFPHSLSQGHSIAFMIWQYSLLGFLFWGSHILLDSSYSEKPSSKSEFVWVSLAAVGIVMFSVYPILRRICMIVLTILLLWKIHRTLPSFWARQTPSFLSGSGIRFLTIGLGLAAVLLYLSMGTQRELSRGSDTVFGVLDGQHEIDALPKQLYEDL